MSLTIAINFLLSPNRPDLKDSFVSIIISKFNTEIEFVHKIKLFLLGEVLEFVVEEWEALELKEINYK